MKTIVYTGLAALALCVTAAFYACSPKESPVQSDFDFAGSQLRIALQTADSIRSAQGKTLAELPSPRNIEPDGSMRLVDPTDWCSGFFPGELWYMYEYTGDDFWKQQAEAYTGALESQQTNRGTHDIGFMMYCSYGNGERLAPNDRYKEVLLESARSLASRFNPTTGCIRSWDNWGPDFPWQYPVIIDNMMNLELLFWAARESGDSTFYKIAVTHADTTMKNHFRPDYSSFHVVDYDTLSGKVLGRQTHQGYADSSAWARGQAWAVYGYTACYRYTGDKRYLDHARKVAGFMLGDKNMPADLVPYWDYDAPNIPNEPRDVSTAAIIASAFYEMYTYTGDGLYKQKADRIVESLSSPAYRAPVGGNGGFLLMHSVGSIPHGSNIDVPLNYADYYFLAFLIRCHLICLLVDVLGLRSFLVFRNVSLHWLVIFCCMMRQMVIFWH